MPSRRRIRQQVVERITTAIGGGASNILAALGAIAAVVSSVSGVLAAQIVGSVNTALAFLGAPTLPVGSEGASLAVSSDVGSASRSAGSAGASVTSITAVLAPQSAGSEGASIAVSSDVGSATQSAGSEGASIAVSSDVGSGTRSAGSEGASVVVSSNTGSASQSVGGRSTSAAWDSTGTATGNTGTATNTTNAGAHSWSTPTNAQGAVDGTISTLSAAATATAADSYDATLKCSALALGTTPSGWTRSKVELLITHSWDLTVGALSTASITVTVQSSGGTVLSTPVNRAQGSGDQATLLTETFDITTAVSGQTDAQLQADQVWCRGVCNLLIITGGNASWNVDAVQIRITYTRSGIA